MNLLLCLFGLSLLNVCTHTSHGDGRHQSRREINGAAGLLCHGLAHMMNGLSRGELDQRYVAAPSLDYLANNSHVGLKEHTIFLGSTRSLFREKIFQWAHHSLSKIFLMSTLFIVKKPFSNSPHSQLRPLRPHLFLGWEREREERVKTRAFIYKNIDGNQVHMYAH